MIKTIVFKAKQYKKIKLKISPLSDFNEILKVMEQLSFPGSKVQEEHIIFAVLELVNNSLRAQRNREDWRDIQLIFSVNNNKLNIFIQDWGGGFDPTLLPYDLNGNIENIDLMGEAFQAYRNKFHNQRFGMGLYIAKKTFDVFNLYFFNHKNEKVIWRQGHIEGTAVVLRLGDNDDAQ